MDPKLIVSRLFVAVPELHYDIDVLKIAHAAGLIDDDFYAAVQKVMKIRKKSASFGRKMRGKDIIQRLTLVANELFSASTVNILRKLGLIDEFEGTALKLAIRAAKRGAAGSLDEVTIVQRLTRVLGTAISSDTVNLIRHLDDERIALIRQGILDRTGRQILATKDAAYIRELLEQSVLRAEQLRGGIKAGRILAEAIQDGRKAESFIQAIVLFSHSALDEQMIRAMVKARLLTPAQGNVLITVMDLGWDVWRKVAKSFEYDSWAARAMLVSQGFLNPDTVAFAVQMGWIDKRTARFLYPAVNAVREILRQGVESYADLPGRRHRVLPGRSPISVYARASEYTDRQLLGLLAEASKDSSREAERLAKTSKFGDTTRARQQRLVARAMHEEMHILWENVGHLTIFGEKQVAAAAVDAMDGLNESLFKKAGNEDALRMLSEAGRSGVDSFISRQENLKPLADRLYKNIDYTRGRIDREINKSLLRGLSAKEMASNLERFVNPKAGGVKYIAMRLARTEINNAFHQSAIRHTREMPWVRGYKWNLSSSHGRPDVCNDYAERKGNLGIGTFKKSEVPSKPHPHCLCFITVVTDSYGDFERGLNTGKYDKYLNQIAKNGLPGEGGGSDYQNKIFQKAIMLGSAAAAPILIKRATPVIKKMLISGTEGKSFSLPTFKGRKVASQEVLDKLVENAPEPAPRNVTRVFKKFQSSFLDKPDLSAAGDPNSANKMVLEDYQAEGYISINNLLRRSEGDLSKFHNKVLSLEENEILDAGTDSPRYRALLKQEDYYLHPEDEYGGIDKRHRINQLDKMARPFQEDTELTRVFWAGNTFKGQDPMSLAKHSFTDHGYTSTEFDGRYYNGHKHTFEDMDSDMVRTKVYAPKGTQGIHIGGSESEIVLGRGTTFEIVSVKKSDHDNFEWDMEMIVTHSPVHNTDNKWKLDPKFDYSDEALEKLEEMKWQDILKRKGLS